MTPYRRRVPASRDRGWRKTFADPRSGFTPMRERVFRHSQVGSPSLFADRVLSVRSIAALPAADRRRVAAEVRGLLATDPSTRGRRRLRLPYRTELFWCRRR
ncbi:MAG: hypothetical protein ACRECT_06210 [Thermoplasmata archaeon]